MNVRWQNGVGLVLLVGLAGCVWYLNGRIQATRRQIVAQQHQLEQSISGAAALVAQSKTLSERSADLALIRAYVPSEAGLGDVVSLLEQHATGLGVTLSIPSVQETSAVDAAAPIEAFRSINLHLEVVGQPKAVLQFMQIVEHLPYLAQVTEWDFEVTPETVQRRSGEVGSALVPPGATQVPQAAPPTARLAFDVLLAVTHNHDAKSH
ncbi:MAG TPA: hypothetical protein VJC05_04145 [Candidatus Andersenbacteria bacterium]|nr:hypothetical protein [Candidatus Andersenbacteria bacterium]